MERSKPELATDRQWVQMQRVLVIGCPGSGKTTFSRRLAEITGLPLHHLDSIWHRPDRTHIPEDAFAQKLEEIMARDRWILDGNFNRTLEMRLRRCDAVFLLEYPVEICLQGVHDRMGKPRAEMPWVETEEDPEFRAFIESFPEMSLPRIYALLRQYREGRNIIIFKSRAEADAFLKQMEARPAPDNRDG